MSTAHCVATPQRHTTPHPQDRRPEWLRRFSSTAHELPAGTSRELGDEGELIYIVEGRLLVSAVDDQGDEIVSSLRRAGRIVGLERLLDLAVPYQLWALSDVRIETVPLERVKDWLGGSVAEPTKSLVRSALEAAGASVKERATLHGRVLTRVSKLLADATTGDGTLRLPRFVMARILSMRPETLSRALKELEQRGAITLKPRLKVVNPDALRQAIGSH